ncbi:MAG: fatty acid--CoA ligase [Alphaproteobacteria bacterium 64-11]|nr:acyl--CoA ligase [Alphaproteobacteria bacterium]OJU08644.1 MAG: fatty acid--CoA ligase [Alphaproteobacteria bacterium 64-11]
MTPAWPGMTLAQAHARLTAPGAPFETVAAVVRGVPMRVWKHVPATAAEAFAAVRNFGPREFLVLGSERVTYDAFARAVLALSATMRAQGLRKGDRVALVMRNLPEWPVVFMAGLLAGAIMVPLNAWWTAPELAYGIQDAGARFVFADAERLSRLADMPPAVEHVFVARAAGSPPGVTVLEDVIGTPGHWGDLPDGTIADVVLSPEDDATIFYTSGTSGAPKGALGTHRSLTTNIFAAPFSLVRNAVRQGEAMPDPATAPQRTTLLAVPFFHVIGSLSVMLPTMAAGGKLVLMHRFEAEAALRLIECEKVTVTGGVPAIMLALLEHPRLAKFDLSSLRLATYGGAPPPVDLPARIAAAFPNAICGHGWGMTETSATCTTHSGPDYVNRPESCGPALPVSRIRVMVEDREATPGEVGELWAFGPNIVKGYWNRPDATAGHFRDGWMKTGDLASIDEEGFCTIEGRATDMVIRGGANIYCTEVEKVLARHPAVADAALVGLPHPLLGEVPAALVQARAPVSQQALQDFAGRYLAAYKVPVRILVSPEPLARNEGGKLVRRELARAFEA